MHVRKLVKSGHASLVTAIPKGWIQRNQLRPGDPIYIDDSGDALTIYKQTEQKTASTDCVIQVDNRNIQSIHHDIVAAYLNNCHHIIIKGTTLTSKVSKIKGWITDLVALEVVEESSDRLVAKSFLNFHDLDLKQLLHRMDNIIRSMIIDAKQGKKDVAKYVFLRDYEVNKLFHLIIKILKTAYLDKSLLSVLTISDLDVLRYWDAAMSMEKIGDRVKNIADVLPNMTKKQREYFLVILTKIEELYVRCMKSLHKMDKTLADAVSADRIPIMNNIRSFMENNQSAICSQASINAFNMTANINDIIKVIRFLDND